MTDQFPGNDSNVYLAGGVERHDAITGAAPPGSGPGAGPSPEQAQGAKFESDTTALLRTLDIIQDTGTLLMDALTQAGGQPIVFKVKRLSVQELIAADLIPKRALQMAGFFMDASEKRAEAVRKRWNLPDTVTPTAEQMQADQFTEDQLMREAIAYIGGPPRDARTTAYAGMYSFVGAVVCAAVQDPRLYFTKEEVAEGEAAGRPGVSVWRIPEPDLWKVFNWALRTEARAVASNVEPFRPTVNAPAVASPREGVRPNAGRSDEV